MTRTFRNGLVAIAVFGALMFGGVALVTRRSPDVVRDAPSPSAPADPPAPLAVPAPLAPPAATSPQPILPAWADPAARATPRERAVAARPMPARTRTLLAAAIARARPDVHACFRSAAAPPARHAPGARRRLSAEGALGTLVLQLEPEQDAFLVTDAAVARRGVASDEELGCAAGTLRGIALPFPGTVPGPSATMRYPLD